MQRAVVTYVGYTARPNCRNSVYRRRTAVKTSALRKETPEEALQRRLRETEEVQDKVTYIETLSDFEGQLQEVCQLTYLNFFCIPTIPPLFSTLPLPDNWCTDGNFTDIHH